MSSEFRSILEVTRDIIRKELQRFLLLLRRDLKYPMWLRNIHLQNISTCLNENLHTERLIEPGKYDYEDRELILLFCLPHRRKKTGWVGEEEASTSNNISFNYKAWSE